jgi:protein TonB
MLKGIIMMSFMICPVLKAQVDNPNETRIQYDSFRIQPDREAMPQGGMNAFYAYIGDNFNYPNRCLKKNIDGYVKLRFTVETDGRIGNITVMEETSNCPEFTQEAVRVLLASPPWIPAMKYGRIIRAYRVIPIRISATRN